MKYYWTARILSGLLNRISIMRGRKIELWPFRNNLIGIDCCLAEIVVRFDLVKINGCSNTRVLKEFAQIVRDSVIIAQLFFIGFKGAAVK
ncbi:MAG: hypothetical protein GY821_11350 [Gammaproteobacteria bacterium]|nr:hypothetical protein [Gammaproteobacteria bacterium]